MVKILFAKYRARINYRSDECVGTTTNNNKTSKLEVKSRTLTHSEMEPLVRIFFEKDRGTDAMGLKQLLDFSKLDNLILQKVFKQDFLEQTIVRYFEEHVVRHNDIAARIISIGFKQFYETLQQQCLNTALRYTFPGTYIVLNNVKDINYGNYCRFDKEHLLNPLLYCSENGKSELVQYLVNYRNANVNHVGIGDMTAIMYAVKNDYRDITTFLFNKGAKLRIGKSCITLYVKDDGMAQLLLELISVRIEALSKQGSETYEMEKTYELQLNNKLMIEQLDKIVAILRNNSYDK